MKNKLQDMNNHLFEMAERLLDDDLCKDNESIQREIDRANALANIADQVSKLRDTQIKEVETSIKAMAAAKDLGYIYEPEFLHLKKGIPSKGYTPEGLPYEE